VHSSYVVATIFTEEDGLQYGYGLMSALNQLIFEEVWPTFVDAPLTLSFRTKKQCCRNMFCLERRPKVQLWLNLIVQPSAFSKIQCQKSMALR
jgi:hypothetical protein